MRARGAVVYIAPLGVVAFSLSPELVFALSTWQCCVHVLRQTVVPTALLIIPLTTPFFSTFCTFHSSCRRRTRVIFFLYTLSPFLLCKEKQSLVTCSMRPKCVVCVRVCVPGWRERNELSVACVDAGCCATVSVCGK